MRRFEGKVEFLKEKIKVLKKKDIRDINFSWKMA
jgi:hypothetical protein